MPTAKPKAAASRANVDRLAATLALEQPVSSVKLVSPSRESVLGKLGIRTVRDLLAFYPYRYIDLTQVCDTAQARIGDTCTVVGSIHEIRLKRPKPKLSLVEITLVDGTGTLIVTCFRQPWLMDRLRSGQRIAVAGKVGFNYGFKRMTNPFIEEVDDGASYGGCVVPLHHATEKLSAAWMRRIVGNAFDACRGADDPLPIELRQRYRLVSRQSAYQGVHFPNNMAEMQAARRRLAYEELLFLELHLKRLKRQRCVGTHPTAHVVDGPHMAALARAVPFALTDEQRRAREEVLGVMAASDAADHLLLGDVGTGKTAVASFALAAAADTGTQALMMAPTEVLARQYGDSLGPLLDAANIPWGVLTASTPAPERTCLLQGVADGTVCVLFGTLALLEKEVAPARVSLVIIDEQQRFGVEQRRALIAKGECPDVLSMTATPIPRSLALTLYGDMTLSYLHHRPLNTAGTETSVCDWQQRGIAYDAAREALNAGHQVYVVCPLVGQQATGEFKDASRRGDDPFLDGGSDDGCLAVDAVCIEDEADLARCDGRAALDHARFLQEKVFPDAKVGVLHGRLSGEDKDRVMGAFREGELDVLVATTVIEVGVDVPNATVMIIEDADRFGLAQLHQLRGRVGRGRLPGKVFLISDSRSPISVKRLQAMERIQDGFELSEYDLSLRREGDILGNRQHGASTLKLVNIVRDRAMIETAHRDADEILAADPDLSDPVHAALARELRILFGEEGET